MRHGVLLNISTMKQFINFSKLILATLVSLGDQICRVYTDLGIPEIDANPYFAKTKGLHDKMEEAFNRERRSQYSQRVKLLDQKRDTIFSSIKHRIRGFLISVVDEERAAATLIWRIVERNGISLDRQKLNVESSSLNKLLSEVQTPESVEAIKLLGLTETFALLAGAQKEFEDAYQSRGINDTERKEYDSASTLRAEFEESLELLLKYTESMAFVNPDSKWAQAHAQIATFAEKVEVDLRQAQGRNDAKEAAKQDNTAT